MLSRKTAVRTAAAVGLSAAAFKLFEGRIGAMLIEAVGERQLKGARLARRTAQLKGAALTTAHYAERAAAPDTAPSARRDLLVLGGFTTDLPTMVPLVVAFLRALPRGSAGCWRVLMLEVPMHGRGAVPGCAAEDFPDGGALEDGALAFMDALGLGLPGGASPPLTVMGYSLGGGGACRLLARAPARFDAGVLVAPGFVETTNDVFIKRMVGAPREVHGWETEAEFVAMMTETVCGVQPEQLHAALPGFVKKGLVRQRAALGAGYFSRFAERLNAAPSERTKLTDMAPAMAACRTPVLLLVGDRDNCIDAGKCRQIERQFGPQWCEMVVLEDVGHLGGPKGGTFERSLLVIAAERAAKFLSEGKGAWPRARL